MQPTRVPEGHEVVDLYWATNFGYGFIQHETRAVAEAEARVKNRSVELRAVIADDRGGTSDEPVLMYRVPLDPEVFCDKHRSRLVDGHCTVCPYDVAVAS